jgi:UDP-4-amino-4,6-dideoxy-L-N-acetyl-beta-L-altrosamine transaminase
MISYGKQSIDRGDVKSVIKCLKSSNLTQGPLVPKFEQELSKYLGFKFCSVVSNGTAAMFLISQLLKWNKNDIIALPPITFLSTASIIEHSKAKPLFIDIDLNNYSMCPKKLEKELIKDKNKKIKAAVITDFGGMPADWRKFYYLKKKYNLVLINDQCHSLGSKYLKKKDYSSQYCDFSTLSFHPVKAITTAEGGAVLMNSRKMYLKSNLLRSHGIERNNKTYWKYKVNTPGLNFRLSDLNCALGLSQIKKIDIYIKKKREIAKEYDKFFSKYSFFKIPNNNGNFFNSYHLYPLLVDLKKLKTSKDKLINFFLKNDIKLQVHYIPINSQPYYKKKYKLNKNKFKNSYYFHNTEISVPIYFELKKAEILHIINTFKKFIKNNL